MKDAPKGFDGMTVKTMERGTAAFAYPRVMTGRRPSEAMRPIWSAVMSVVSGGDDVVLTFPTAPAPQERGKPVHDSRRAYDAALRYIKRVGAQDTVEAYVVPDGISGGTVLVICAK